MVRKFSSHVNKWKIYFHEHNTSINTSINESTLRGSDHNGRGIITYHPPKVFQITFIQFSNVSCELLLSVECTYIQFEHKMLIEVRLLLFDIGISRNHACIKYVIIKMAKFCSLMQSKSCPCMAWCLRFTFVLHRDYPSVRESLHAGSGHLTRSRIVWSVIVNGITCYVSVSSTTLATSEHLASADNQS